MQFLPKLQMGNDRIRRDLNQMRAIDLQILEHRVCLFKSLKELISDILFGKSIKLNTFNSLSEIEFFLLAKFCKKKYHLGQGTELSFASVKSLDSRLKSKRFEENVKFVFLKGIKFLKKVFYKQLYPLLRSKLPEMYDGLDEFDKIDYAFYGFYFGHLLDKAKQPIEAFFWPRYLISDTGPEMNNNFPKTVSKMYISKLKMSKKFTADFKEYLKLYFGLEMNSFIQHKANDMISDWEEIFLTKGALQLKNEVNKRFGPKSKTKLVWSVFEINVAAQELLEFFK